MHFSSRVLSELERGLIGQLNFSFHSLGIRELRSLRVGDPIRLEVRVHNGSGLPLVELRGTLRQGARTRFPAQTFVLDRLEPRATATVAEVRGVFRGPADPQEVDSGLARVAVSTRIDLSHLLFEEWDKPVQLAPEASPLETTPPRQRRRGTFGKAIPLSVL